MREKDNKKEDKLRYPIPNSNALPPILAEMLMENRSTLIANGKDNEEERCALGNDGRTVPFHS